MDSLLKLQNKEIKTILSALRSYEVILQEESNKSGLTIIKTMINGVVQDLQALRDNITKQTKIE